MPIRILRDIPYAEARIGHAEGGMRRTSLTYDAYLPARAAAPVPALVLAFGGAFHRGSKEDDAFPGAGDTGTNTAMADYARRFAEEGFACFSIRYRLAPEDPVAGDTPVITRPDAVPMTRIAQVRELMGLKPATPADMARVMEAAIDDMAAAARHVAAQARDYGVDPARVVLGGWSAGARCALYAAYGEGVPCAGVLALSGIMQPEDMAAHLAAPQPRPPVLLITAGRDLPYLDAAAMAAMVRSFRDAGVAVEHVTVPGRDHWYPADAATSAGVSVQQVMRAALQHWIGQ